jgi:WD40 repeat protein
LVVYTGCGDTNARCFDVKSGALKRTFKGHAGSVNSLRVIGKRLFTGSYDGTLRIWDVSDLAAEKGSNDKSKDGENENANEGNSYSPTVRIENETSSSPSYGQTISVNEKDTGYDE